MHAGTHIELHLLLIPESFVTWTARFPWPPPHWHFGHHQNPFKVNRDAHGSSFQLFFSCFFSLFFSLFFSCFYCPEEQRSEKQTKNGFCEPPPPRILEKQLKNKFHLSLAWQGIQHTTNIYTKLTTHFVYSPCIEYLYVLWHVTDQSFYFSSPSVLLGNNMYSLSMRKTFIWKDTPTT